LPDRSEEYSELIPKISSIVPGGVTLKGKKRQRKPGFREQTVGTRGGAHRAARL